jgi:hypothetical protein
MKALSVAIAHALIVCTVFVFLGGCGGPQSQSAGVAVPESGVSYAHHDGSWMNPNVINIVALIYVSSSYPNDRVFIYNYPQGRLQGEITGFLQPAGQCVDAKGNVYIANSGASSVVEIPRGGKNPIKTLGTNGFPIGCAVSPNGDLAVANSFTPGAQDGNIQVSKGASGVPKQYNNSDCVELFPPGYDKNGNLFTECYDPFKKTTKIAYLSSGGNSLQIALFKQKISQPGSIMWDGKYLAVTDSAFEARQSTGIYQVSPSSTGDVLMKVGSSNLRDACGGGNTQVFQPFILGEKNTPANEIQGTEVIGGNDRCEYHFDTWSYPAGGDESSHFEGAPYSNGQSVSILKSE